MKNPLFLFFIFWIENDIYKPFKILKGESEKN